MKHKPFGPKQTRTVVVASLLSLVIATPMMSQPLGLVTAINTVPSSEAAQSAPVIPESSQPELAPAESVYTSDNGLSRSQSDDLDSDSAVQSASVSETTPGPTQTVSTEPQITESESTEVLETEPAGPVFALVDISLYISASELNMRLEPDLESDIVDKLPMGTKIHCIGEGEEWLEVEYNDQTGYVSAQYTSLEMVFVPVSQTRYISASSLNLRSSPDTNAEIIEKLSRDVKVTRVGVGDGWSQIKTGSGKTGYVVSDYLTPDVPASVLAAMQQAAAAPSASQPAAQQGSVVGNADIGNIVSIAYQGIGVPYVFSGSSLSGFDCTGFTSWVYRQVGINIPRSTSGYYSVGASVSYDNIRPGDIIAFDRRRGDGKTAITHVGLYVGNGQMLHASWNRQRIAEVSVSHYLRYGGDIVTIRRIVN